MGLDWKIARRLTALTSAETLCGTFALTQVVVLSRVLEESVYGAALLFVGLFALLEAVVAMPIDEAAFNFGTLRSTDGSVSHRPRAVTDKQRNRIAAIFLAAAILAAGFKYQQSGWSAMLALISITAFGHSRTTQSAIRASLLLRQNFRAYRRYITTEAFIVSSSTIAIAFLCPSEEFCIIFGTTAGRTANTLLWKPASGAPFNPRRFTAPERSTLIAFSRPISASAALGWLSSYSDRYLLAATLSLDSVPIYNAASAMAGRPMAALGSSLSANFRPELIASTALEESSKRTLASPEAYRIILTWSRSLALISAAALAVAVLVGPEAVARLFPPPYHAQVPTLLLILILSHSATMLGHPYDNLMIALRRTGSLTRIQAATTPLTPISVYVLGATGGIYGAAIGRILGEFSKSTIIRHFALRTARGTTRSDRMEKVH